MAHPPPTPSPFDLYKKKSAPPLTLKVVSQSLSQMGNERLFLCVDVVGGCAWVWSGIMVGGRSGTIGGV